MQRVSFDPGLTQQFQGRLSRFINRNGTFNVRRRGTTWRDFHPYLILINMRWVPFLACVFLGYLLTNTLFAVVYFALGPGQLTTTGGTLAGERFADAFFFSSHTLTTVGYGNIAPKAMASNIVSAIESLVGVLGFAVATGLLFGRVSRPSARLGFSTNILIAPYQDGSALQFRVVNLRRNSIMELQARVMLMTVEPRNGDYKRTYTLLRLEREQVVFFPLTWTVVHPIDSESPLYGKTVEDLERMQAEVLILLKGYDDTFNQTVLARHSYTRQEFLWGARFAPAFHVDDQGELVLEVDRVGDIR
jgi:inward rectifier potassium channel